jgi:hypothetical protein
MFIISGLFFQPLLYTAFDFDFDESSARQELTRFHCQQQPELMEEPISRPLRIESFHAIQNKLILQHVSGRSCLKCVRIDATFPKPVCRPELDVTRVNRGNTGERLSEGPPTMAVLQAERYVGDPIRYRSGIALRDRIEIARLLTGCAEEVPVAAPEGEAVLEG